VGRSLGQLVPAAAAAHPHKAALVAGDRTLTYADLHDRVRRAAGALAGLGVGKGDRVATMLGTVPEFVEVLHGAWHRGAAVAPLNVMLTPDEAGYVLADADARVAMVDRAHLPVVLAVRDRLAELIRWWWWAVGPHGGPTPTRSSWPGPRIRRPWW
jgi:fatty-acyl-CoA synthase